MAFLAFNNNTMAITDDGGVAFKFVNKTGAASVKGTVLEIYDDTAVDNAVDICAADAIDYMGVMYSAGVADGSEVWVVTEGKAYVLLKDSTAATRDYWVVMSDTAGRADATNAAPPGGTVQALEAHMGEMGHALENVTAGTDELALIVLHKN